MTSRRCRRSVGIEGLSCYMPLRWLCLRTIRAATNLASCSGVFSQGKYDSARIIFDRYGSQLLAFPTMALASASDMVTACFLAFIYAPSFLVKKFRGSRR